MHIYRMFKSFYANIYKTRLSSKKCFTYCLNNFTNYKSLIHLFFLLKIQKKKKYLNLCLIIIFTFRRNISKIKFHILISHFNLYIRLLYLKLYNQDLKNFSEFSWINLYETSYITACILYALTRIRETTARSNRDLHRRMIK